MSLGCLLIFLILNFTSCKVPKEIENKDNTEVKIERYYAERIGKLYLEQNHIKADSIQLHDLYFSIDTLIQIDKHTWHYMYSVRCGSDCYTSNQLIISEKDGKFNIQLAILLSSGFDINETYLSNVPPENIMEFSHGMYSLSLDSAFFNDRRIIKEYTYKGNKVDNGAGVVRFFKLDYDKNKQLYYNKKLHLKGKYIVRTLNEEKEIIINQEVFSIKFTESEYVFFSNHWYEINPKENKLWSVIY